MPDVGGCKSLNVLWLWVANRKNALGGSFLSVDPVLTDANTGTGFNRYNYANNNPYRYIDLDGRNPIVLRLTFKFSYEVASAFGATTFGIQVGLAAYDILNPTTLVIAANRNDSNSNSSSSAKKSNSASDMPPDDDNKQRKDKNRENNRKTEGKEQPASDKVGKQMGNQIEKDIGKEAKQDFHGAKEAGAPDRTMSQLKQDAIDIYQTAGKEIPKWLK